MENWEEAASKPRSKEDYPGLEEGGRGPRGLAKTPVIHRHQEDGRMVREALWGDFFLENLRKPTTGPTLRVQSNRKVWGNGRQTQPS